MARAIIRWAWVGLAAGTALSVSAQDASKNPLSAYWERGERAPAESIRMLYRDGMDEQVVEQAGLVLESGEMTEVEAAEIHFWRGAALRRQGRTTEALTAFETAAELGMEGMELDFERAMALAGKGRQQEAEQSMERTRNAGQEGDERARELEGRWQRTRQTERIGEVRLVPFVGYDSNVFGVSDETAPAGGSDEASFFAGGRLETTLSLYERREQAVRLDVDNAYRSFADQDELSYSEHRVGLLGRTPVGSRVDLEGRAGIEEAALSDGGHLRTVRTLAPSLICAVGGSQDVALSTAWSRSDYYGPSSPTSDRDGDAFRVSVSTRVDAGSGWRLGPSVSVLTYDAEGSDHDHHAWGGGLSVEMPALLGLACTVSTQYLRAQYDEEHSRLGFAEPREDERTTAALSLSSESLAEALGFAPAVSIGYARWESNVAIYDFERWEPRIELTLLSFTF